MTLYFFDRDKKGKKGSFLSCHYQAHYSVKYHVQSCLDSCVDCRICTQHIAPGSCLSGNSKAACKGLFCQSCDVQQHHLFSKNKTTEADTGQVIGRDSVHLAATWTVRSCCSLPA